MQALHDLARLAQDYPDSPLPDAQIGDILRLQQHFPEAVAAYDQAIARLKSPNKRTGCCSTTRGIAHDRTHEWPKARGGFRARAGAGAGPAVRC